MVNIDVVKEMFDLAETRKQNKKLKAENNKLLGLILSIKNCTTDNITVKVIEKTLKELEINYGD